jgi:PAS domain S-box-containing protein
MNPITPASNEIPAEIASGLADPSIAALMGNGAPVLAASTSPFTVLWANEAALSFFAVDDAQILTAKLAASDEPGARRLRELAGTLLPGAPVRLERLRFFIDGHAQVITFMCRRSSSPALLFAGAMGVRPQPRVRFAPPLTLVPSEPAASSDAPSPPVSLQNIPSAEEASVEDAPAHVVAEEGPAPVVAEQDVAAPVAEQAASDDHAPVEEVAASSTEEISVEVPAEIVPAARTLEGLREELAVKYRGAQRLRFLWRTDASHRLVEIGEALRDLLGPSVAGFENAPASALFETLGDEQGRNVIEALERRASFTPVEVMWPVEDVSARVPVSLGALPALGRDRQFEGFKGFGVIHLDRLIEAEKPVAPAPENEESEPEAIWQEVAAAETAPETTVVAEQDEVPAAQTESLLNEAPAAAIAGETQGDESVEQSADTSAQEIIEHPAFLHQAEVLEAAAEELDLTSAELTEPELVPPTEAVAADADAASAAQETSAQSEDAIVDSLREDIGESTLEEPTEHAPDEWPQNPYAHAPNVVALRPFQPARPTPAPETPAAPVEADSAAVTESVAPEAAPEPSAPASTTALPPAAKLDQGVSLSSNERNAFREIARALGAKVKTDQDLAEERNKAEARERKDEAKSEVTAELPPDPVIIKREETQRSLARIRDLLQISTHDEPQPAEPAFVASAPAPEPVPEPEPAPALAAASLEANSSVLFDRLPLGVLVSRGGVPVYANRTLLDALGYRDADELHMAGGLDRMFRGREPDALTKEADGGAIPVISASGDVQPFDVRMQTMDWGGEPASVMTFRRSSEQELQQRIKTLEMDARQRDAETRELHAILDTATDGVVVIDHSGRILALNRSAEALFGYEQNEIAGEPFRSLLAGESHAAAEDYLNGLKQNGVASVLNDGREVVGRARQGGPIPMFMTLGRVGSGETSKFCAVLRDITQWKKAERELKDARRDAERASALKSDFLAKISHEIRTPLNAILGFAEVIMDERFGPVGNERYKDYLKDIHSSGTHVMSLVNDLLDLSKIEAGKVELNFGAVDANKVIAECASLMQTQAVRERVIVRMALAPRLPQIVADERSLKQIILNLLSNALKFNEPGGQVIISTALTDAGNAVLRIKDTGIGMTDAEVETALEPFRQVATSRQTTGTGLGLPLTKALVEANRASFTIKSRKHEGTLVEVSFPSTRVLAE